MQTHLVRWDRAYRAQGLTILYVADGRRVTPEVLTGVMRADGAGFPLLLDEAGRMTQAYQVRAYPTAYVIGRDGRVVWEGIPHFDPAAPEGAIRAGLGAAR
jgi:AhpC/TSA family